MKKKIVRKKKPSKKSKTTKPKNLAPILSFKEIKDDEIFENLTARYFDSLERDLNIINVEVDPSGKGSDGGRDILVTFQINDSIVDVQRKWVVQCKFYNSAVNKSTLADVNIPSLIHEYGADGYLLICKNNVTSNVTEMFENLRRNCKFKYSYEIWIGEVFRGKILANKKIHQQYFPKYFSETNMK